MLCSGCSETVTPIVVWDIDGTLGAYHWAFTEFVRRYWNLDVNPHTDPWYGEGEFEDYLGLTKERYRQAKLAYRLGGNKRWLPIYQGAQEAMTLSATGGRDPDLSTSRGGKRHGLLSTLVYRQPTLVPTQSIGELRLTVPLLGQTR